MTGRRSHGRLSALNGVVHQGIEEPDAVEPARPDLWGARVSNDPGLPDHVE